MIDDSLATLLTKLTEFTPLNEFKFGHSPIQLEYFQTAQQRGNEKWEYWQHVLQLRSVQQSLEELKVSKDDLEYEILDALKFWPPWNLSKRKRSLPRLNLKKKYLQRSLDEKALEATRHLALINDKYAHLKELTEDDILKEEPDYWAMRLGRQLGAAHLGRVLGVSDGELLAVLSLPQEQQRQVFDSMKLLIGKSANLLPTGKT